MSERKQAAGAAMLDCLVIGGGPAGLTAGLYLARFQRKFLVVDAGAPRAAAIPTSHNLPAFPDGLTGPDLIARQRETLLRYGPDSLLDGRVEALTRADCGFSARIAAPGRSFEIAARRVLLATGAQDVELDLPDQKDAVRRGLVRYCPICDGFEARDKKIGVIGFGARGLNEALFIARAYGADVTLLTLGRALDLTPDQQARCDRLGVKLARAPVRSLQVEGDHIAALHFGPEGEMRFDTLYSALGLTPRGQLGLALGAAHDDCGALTVDPRQQTSVPGLYAAGGVVEGLDQIVVAMGQAAVAATHIHNHCEETVDRV
ncbi:thioredoxin reductase (NADPH) [Rhodoblastus acidophilus]|uniref:NAD(P)/FAD-dependent oxidoreductase n=1 Tax=Rhodoblastus acidophilus TaxID=1074 RepID=UPI0022258D25|nr:NAD(P)/FAD-dependent oxidoreductase [Rhodoblastus acidophilus]MCW2315205.1 thioredoxin reductase (NADPH) [Rhodoblastus acidophilus]